MKLEYLPHIVTLFAFSVSILAYDHLAPEIPIHWGIDGRIDYTASKGLGVYLNPGAMVLAYFFFWMITHIDRPRVRRLREVGIYDALRDCAVSLFGYAQLLALGIGLNWVSGDANFLIGAFSTSIIVAVLHLRRPPHKNVLRLLRHLGITPSNRAADQLYRILIVVGAAGVCGTLSGRAQIWWPLVPLVLGLFWTRRRFPSSASSST